MEYDYIKHLTDQALADRLRRMVANPRGWAKAERDALIAEAADRLDGGQ